MHQGSVTSQCRVCAAACGTASLTGVCACALKRAVRGQLRSLRHSRGWRLRPGGVRVRLRASIKWRVRQGAPAWRTGRPPCMTSQRSVRTAACASTATPRAPGAQCASNCNSCATAGDGKCDAGRCALGYGLTARGTCALVRLLETWTALLAACPTCAVSPPAICALPARTQCAAYCDGCSQAGRCDPGNCHPGYGPTSIVTGGCGPVRA